jgi:hypothetical protein
MYAQDDNDKKATSNPLLNCIAIGRRYRSSLAPRDIRVTTLIHTTRSSMDDTAPAAESVVAYSCPPNGSTAKATPRITLVTAFFVALALRAIVQLS